MKKHYKALSLIMTLVFVVIPFPSPAFAAKANARPIRIAYPIQEGLTEIDENGYYTGYTYEYLEKIAQNTGWDYEYVTVPGTLTEQIAMLMEMLEAGEVDLMGGMVYDEDTANRFTYCRNKYGTSHTVLQVLKESCYNREEENAAFTENSLRIAIRSKTGRMADEVTTNCKRADIEFSFLECDSLDDGIDMLKKGQADALASSEMFVREELQIVASFAPKPFYFVTGKNTDSDLMRTLDTAIINIKRYNPTYQQKLYIKYFSPYANSLSLSEWEREYTAALPALKIGMDSNRPPFQHYSYDAGWHGIGIDILAYITDQTGIHFELINVTDRAEQYAMLLDGELDILLGAPYDYAFAREYNVILSEPYLIQSTVLVSRKDAVDLNSIERPKVALIKNSYTTNQALPEEILNYENAYECLNAVLNGEANCAYLDQLSAQYFLEDPEFSKLKIATYATRESSRCFAMRKSTDPALLNIINRSINTISHEEQNTIVLQNLSTRHKLTLRRYLQENPMAIVIFLCIVVALVILISTLYIRRRAKEAKLTQIRLDKHLNLCSLAGDIFIEYDYATNRLMASCPSRKNEKPAEFFEVDLMTSDEYMKNKAAVNAFVDILKNGISEPMEIQIPFFNGSTHWVELTVSKMYDEQNKPLYSMARLKLIDEKFTAQETLRHQAQRDGLTQLYNIGYFTQLVKEQLKAFSDGQTDALIIVDIDYFKSVNDTYGHMAGNEMLQKVALILQRVCPDSAIIGRMGGDEFVVYLSEVRDSAEVETVCKALCEDAEKIQVSETVTLSFSIGAIIMDRPMERETAFEKADVALYDVKRNGRNGFKVLPL